MLKMMRLAAFAPLLAVLLSCSGIHKINTQKTMEALNGTWVPVRQEIGGQQLPEAAYSDQKLEIIDSTYIVTAESVDKGVVRFGEGDRMDIYGREGVNSGKHFTAIYKLVDGQLTICYNLAGGAYPESFSTEGHSLYFLSVFERQ